MLDVCLLGTGGMMPLPNRRLASMMARYNGKSILIDCGEGTQVSVREKGWSLKPVDIICFTHFHADHISGLPGLLLTMGNTERTEPLLIAGPKGIENVVNSLRVIAPDLPFKIEFRELKENRESIRLDGYRIEAFKVSHNVVCYGYSVIIDRKGKFDSEKAKEMNIPINFWSILQNGETVEHEGKTFTPEMVMGPERKGIKLTYCTDTRPTDIIVESAKEADLFICEGMYGEKDKLDKAKEFKHMTIYEAASLGKRANPDQMWLTHYSPSLFRPEEFMEEARKIFPKIKPGKDLKSVTLEFMGE